MKNPTDTTAPISKGALWAGRIMSYLPVPMFLMSAVFKFSPNEEAAKGFEHLGVSLSQAPALGILELICLAIYLIPRTAVLGAILLTGYLGGATAIHVRVGDPFFMTPLLGILLWGGLWLRDRRLQVLIPLQR